MARDSGTRSGLLWEVERLLKECKELPQMLIMENVPQIISAKNRPHFEIWKQVLDNLGYKSELQILNAKDYGIPQNRKRCFMVSVPTGYYYEFPKPTGCKVRLKDMLQSNVDEKYYLSEELLLIKTKK